jgi:hypothetical protein
VSVLKPRLQNRLETLDQLRGFFIIVIIIDHLGRWPSLLEAVTGRGSLWVNAACGFVIISGLLIGYVRGHKDRQKPFLDTAKKLIKRALILYLWLIICTVIYAAITWYSPRPELLAWVEIPRGEWWLLITSAMNFDYTNNWVHFLSLYALFLFFSPILIYLLRKKLAWVGLIISAVAYTYGLLHSIEWLQWQMLFFVPAIAGFYLEDIKKFWKNLSTTKRRITTFGFYGVTVGTIILSTVVTRFVPDAPTSAYINSSLSINPLSIGVILLAFVWFVAFLLFFSQFEKFIHKRLGWLLYPIGTSSLTAYIVHPVTLILMSFLFAASSSIILNTLIGIACVIGTWFLVKQRWVQKIIPR